MLNSIAKKIYFALNRLTKLTPDAYYLQTGVANTLGSGVDTTAARWEDGIDMHWDASIKTDWE